MTPQELKERLRRQAAALPRANVPHLLEQFLALPQVEAAHTVMVFYGVGREPDTTALIDQLLAMGKRVALPVCLPQRKMEARIITSQDQLIPNHYGIPEPDGVCPIVPQEDVDVVLVPNMMCDRAGYRLGQGGGYYDRFFAQEPDHAAIGYCFDRQVLEEEILLEVHDRRMDWIVTENRVIDCRKRRR